jgi:hypothetical protein
MELEEMINISDIGDLFTIQHYPERPGYRDQDTSREAAEKVSRCDEIREKIYALLSKPMSDWDLAEALRMPFENVQPRRSELVAKGLVEFSGEYGKSGRSPMRVKKWVRI